MSDDKSNLLTFKSTQGKRLKDSRNHKREKTP